MNAKRILFVVGIILGLVCPISAQAAATLTVTPLTWNIIGLDSNDVTSGPENFPVGAHVCNTGDVAATNVTSTFVWDTTDSFIDLRPGSLSSFTGANAVASLAAGSCTDFYYEAQVTRNSSAYNHTARYHITATATGLGTSSTPTPRELYVEHLISQNRNGITDVKLNGVSIPAGGTMTLIVGNTYTIELDGFTATQGYNQLESFINFPNTIFQIISVSTTYTADADTVAGNPYDKLYADACTWDNDPGSPNYRSCIGGDDKAGGTVVTTYTVKILSGAGTSQTLNTLLYDFSGSSYHYNADFTTGARITSIIGPSSVTIQKTFTPKAISPGGTSVMSFKLTNPTTETFTGVNFTDSLPSGLVVAGTPGVTTSGCVAGAFSPALIGGETSVSFANGTLSPNSVCTITVNVTAASAGTYPNTTGHLFINTSTDTGNTGTDTLTASSAGACTPGQTLANWTVPVGTTANPPDTTGGVPTTTAFNVSTATASAFLPGSTNIVTTGGSNDTTAWSTWGYKTDGQYVDFVVDTSKYSGVSMSFYVQNDGTSVGPTSLVVSYDSGSGFTNILTISNPAATFTLHTIDFTGLTSTGGNTTFRITGSGANNNNSGAGVVYDDIKFTGCSIPAPAPTITKSFLSNPIVKGATSSLSFTINNTAAGNQALTGVAFTDVLPAGLSVADSTSSQCGGTNNLTTTAATRTIALTGGSLAAGGSCTFTVTVTGTTEGVYDNVSGYISSTQSGTSTNYATASLTVIAPPVLAKSFSPTSIFTGNTSTLSFNITNPNLSSSLSGIGFTDTLPGGVTVATSGPTTTCSGSLSTTAPSSISFSGGSLAANNNCTFSVTVTGATAGPKNNTTTAVTSTEGGSGNTASGSLVVNDQTASTDLTKQVSTTGTDPWTSFIGVATGSNIFYRFKVYNSGDLPFIALSVSDPTLASTVNPDTCNWTAFLPLAPGGTATCVTGPISATAGSHANTATAQGTYGGTKTSTSSPSTATDATTGLTIAKSVTETYFTAAGNVLHYSYLVTNSGFAPLLGPVTVTDDKATVTCPAVTTVGNLNNYLDPGESITCPPAPTTATYTVVAGDVTAKFVTNTAFATVSGVTSPTDSKTVNLAPDLTVTKSNNVSGSVELGNTFTWTLTVSNAASAGAASFANTQTLLTDDLPTTGATYVLGAVTTAGGTTGTISCAIATNTLTCTASGAVTIPAGGSFSVPITVTPTAVGSLVNPRSIGTCAVDPSTVIPEIDETNNNCTPNTVTVTATAPTAADLTIAKSHSGDFTQGQTGATYTLTVTNAGSASTSGTVTVSDTLPTGLSATGIAGMGWTCVLGTLTCTRTDSLGAGGSYPVITLTVDVAADAPSTLVNVASVSGGDEVNTGNDTASDPTTVGALSGIPTLSEWGMILLALLLALEGVRSLRTRINH